MSNPLFPLPSYLLSILLKDDQFCQPGPPDPPVEFCPFEGHAGLSAVIQPIVGSFIDTANHLVDTRRYLSTVADSSWCRWTPLDSGQDTGGLRTLTDTGGY